MKSEQRKLLFEGVWDYEIRAGSSSSCRIIKLSSSIALCMLELYR